MTTAKRNKALPPSYAKLIRDKKLSGATQRDILYWINQRRNSDGWSRLTITEMGILCRCDRHNACKAILDLTRRGIVEATSSNPKKRNSAKLYRLNPKSWATAPAYKTPELKAA